MDRRKEYIINLSIVPLSLIIIIIIIIIMMMMMMIIKKVEGQFVEIWTLRLFHEKKHMFTFI